MKTPANWFRLGAVLLLPLALGAAGPARHAGPARTPASAATAATPDASPQGGTAVTLSVQPRTWMDSAARRLVAQDIAEARRNREAPLILVGAAKLSAAAADRQALFVQLQSARECGSAGCSTQVFLYRNGQWARVLDGLSGKLRVAGTHTKGMADLLTDDDRYTWNGTAYVSSHPAPQIDLRPRG